MNLFFYSRLNPEIKTDDFINMNRYLARLNLFGTCQVGYIASEHDPQRLYFNKAKQFYHQLGIENIFYFDLENEYDSTNESKLFQSDIIHLTSGNTYTYLSNLKKRNLMAKLRKYAEEGGVLVGVSAGCHLLCKTISAAKFGDENKIKIEDLNALGLVDFKVIPHYNRKKDKLEEIKKLSLTESVKIYLLEDGNGIIVDGDNTFLLGNSSVINGE